MQTQALTLTHGSIAAYMAQVARIPLLSPQEEFELATHYYKYNDAETAHKLIAANLRFVVKIAHEYKNFGARLPDLIQEGNIGLMHALKKFDPYKGFRFISYAVWWIRAYMQNFIMQTYSIVKIGTTQAQRKLFYKLKQVRNKLFNQKDVLSNEDIKVLADKFDVKEKEIELMNNRLGHGDMSLDTPLNDEATTSHLELIPSEDNPEYTVATQEEKAWVNKKLESATKKLNTRELYILKNRLMNDEPQTLNKIGKHFGITRERARQIEAGTKAKLKEAFTADSISA